MKLLKTILLAGGVMMTCAAAAQAADLPTRKGVEPAPVKPNCFADFWSYMNSSAADCPLSYWGVTFYGQIDMGVGYETNAAKLDKYYPNGIQQFISKQSHGASFVWAPNGLSQSNVGLKWKEQIAGDTFFIGDVNFGFDPATLGFADGPRSLTENNTLTQINQRANGDSSRTYGPINSRAWGGFSNKSFGTLTYGRHYAFSNDNDGAYDPFGGAYNFSLIGNSSTIGGGLGDTELARFNNSIRYLYADHGVRAGVLTQVGGWSAGNNAQYALQADLGFDWQGLSMDGVYMWSKDAVALSTYGAAVNPLVTTLNATTPIFGSQLKATIENVQGGQIVAKYKWDRFTGFGGYQYERISNPSDLPTGAVLRYFNGGVQAAYGTTIQGVSAFPVSKVQQVFWLGGKYAVTPTVDFAAAWYHVWQNDYLGTTEVAGVTCAANAKSAGGNFAPQGAANSKCAGSEDVVSAMLDWKAYKRLDLYGGVSYSKVNGGMANGFFASSNVLTSAGLRFSF